MDCTDPSLRTNSPFRFEIKFGDENLPLLEGSGVVKWIRHVDGGQGPKGVGVEIETLNAEARTAITGLTDRLKVIPFIPKGPFPDEPS